MKILLINAPYTFPDAEIHRTEMLGIEYLSSSLKQAGFKVFIYDPTLTRSEKIINGLYYYGEDNNTILDVINSIQPDCIGISCHYSFSSENVYSLAKDIKEKYKNIKIILGGLFVSIHGKKALLECDAIDFGIKGESEKTLVQLLYSNFTDMTVEGLIYRENSVIIENDKKHYIEILDSLPFPDRDILNRNNYMLGTVNKLLYGLGFKPALSLLTSRSCPNKCSFCNMNLVHGPRWRKRSSDNVIEEIDIMINKYKAEHVFIMDDNFTFNINRVKNICTKIIANNYKFRWNTPNGISVKNIDIETAELMKKAGCANVFIAIESGNEYMRNVIMNKKVSNDEIISAVECFNKVNIPVTGAVITGMQGETKEIADDSYNFLKSLKLTSIIVSFATPFPGTKMRNDLEEKGIIKKDLKIKMDNYKLPVFLTDDFSVNDLLKRKNDIKNLFSNLKVLEEIEKNENC